MIITDISPFKGDTVCVELDSGKKIYIHKSLAVGLKSGIDITDSEADELAARNDKRRARERALYLLESREHSYGELFDKLEKNYPEEICFEVCNDLSRLGLINDKRYASKLCRSLFEGKKLGKYRVRQEMRMKGLTDEVIEEALEEFETTDDPFSRLELLVEQKYERYLTDRKGVIKVKNALARKGYSYNEINEVLDLYDLDFDQ